MCVYIYMPLFAHTYSFRGIWLKLHGQEYSYIVAIISLTECNNGISKKRCLLNKQK